jgi:hypothetical protein
MPHSLASLNHRLLALMVNQFKTSHQGMPPEKIVLTPQAALALALKEAYGNTFLGVLIEALPFTEKDVTSPGNGTRLGIFMHGTPEAIRACDLR